ncbi:MAG: hypothetical protein EBU90_15420 [Proteobacteria bacterium]|nr:hypothetical protein [Pseudomonadota bacterium]NBP16203.1 hypothetical protein [bacterium]
MKTGVWLKYLITNTSLLIPLQQVQQLYTSPPLFYLDLTTTTTTTTNTNTNTNTNTGTTQTEINYRNVLELAKMSYNVYYTPEQGKWYDVELNRTVDISASEDTVHAYLFGNDDYNAIVFKGTSIYWGSKSFGSDTVYNDKYNDNLFFSCCFYQESNLFNKQDCECTANPTPDPDKCPNDDLQFSSQRVFMTQRKCYRECYRSSKQYHLNYYRTAETVMEKASQVVDLSKVIVLAGHSLGGTLATMMGIKYDKQIVTFEAPGEAHYLKLAGLVSESANFNNIYHFGHTADIIFTGRCNGVFSWCYLGGYIMETKCHLGHVCSYDSIKELGISESIYTHKIKYVIENIMSHWNDTLPACILQPECEDCSNWNYK